MNDCIKCKDQELAHIKADEIIVKVALHTGLSKGERLYLANLYELVEKWYA